MNATRMAIVFTMLLVAGCGGRDPLDADRPRRNPAGQFGGQMAPADQAEQATAPALPPPPPPAAQGETAGTSTAPPPPPPPTIPQGPREVAKAGVGKKGRSLKPGGLITTPAVVFFRVGQRMVFDVQIPHALDLYKAEHGHAPKTHAEFMREIIEANSFQLPELPRGGRYVYDPKTAQLMVEHPGR
jgi:hypothetical protein